MVRAVKVLVQQFDQNQRGDLILSACDGATLSWLAHFVDLSNPNSHHTEQNMATEPDPWLPPDTHTKIKSCAIDRIRKAIADGSILEAPQVISVLYRFKEMIGNNNKLLEWLESIDNGTLVVLCNKLVQLAGTSLQNQVAKAGDDLFGKGLSEKIEAAINSELLPENSKAVLRECLDKLREPEAHADSEDASLRKGYDVAT